MTTPIVSPAWGGAEAAASQAREVFLRQLPSVDFAPPEESVVAVDRHARACLPVSSEAIRPDAESVQRFCSEFWGLLPAARRARWGELNGDAMNGPVSARLRALEPGLDVVVVSHPNALVDEVAVTVRELFTSDRRGQAIRQAQFLARAADITLDMREAALELWAAQPELANLAARLLDRLAKGPPQGHISPIGEMPEKSLEAVGKQVACEPNTVVPSYLMAEDRDSVRAKRVFQCGLLMFFLIVLAIGLHRADCMSWLVIFLLIVPTGLLLRVRGTTC